MSLRARQMSGRQLGINSGHQRTAAGVHGSNMSSCQPAFEMGSQYMTQVQASKMVGERRGVFFFFSEGPLAAPVVSVGERGGSWICHAHCLCIADPLDGAFTNLRPSVSFAPSGSFFFAYEITQIAPANWTTTPTEQGTGCHFSQEEGARRRCDWCGAQIWAHHRKSVQQGTKPSSGLCRVDGQAGGQGGWTGGDK